MTKYEVLDSISLKKRFCKDCNLPISVFDNPYFAQRLNIINNIFCCIEAFDAFCKELEAFNNEQDYFEYYNATKDNIISYLKNNESYQKFNNAKLKVTPTQYSKNNLYVDNNENQKFISLDMIKANFSALQHYDVGIFDGAKTWEEFISKFTNSQHIINSKYIRQVIMGACNPKRQIAYERMLMSELLDIIITELSERKPFEIYSLGEDEILLKITDDIDIVSYTKTIIESTPFKGIIRVKPFKLEKIKHTDGWIKSYYLCAGSEYPRYMEFKCLSAEIYHQVVKMCNYESITNDDLVFYHNGELAMYLKPIQNPFK